MTEEERRLQISLRLKAARYLAGSRVGNRASPLGAGALASHDALVDEGITPNRIEEIEQMKTPALRRDLDALIRALNLPDDWFAGLYPSERGKDISDSLGAALLGVAEGARELRQAPGAAAADSRERGRRRPAAGRGSS